MEKREPSYSVGGNLNWCNHHGEKYDGDSFKKLGIKLPYDPAIPLFGTYLEKNVIQNDIHTPMLIAAVFTIDRM